jgi:hypothetical protein
MEGMMCSGLVGMSPEKDSKESNLLVYQLNKTGAIDEAVFSIFIDAYGNSSAITFGGYDLEKYS